MLVRAMLLSAAVEGGAVQCCSHQEWGKSEGPGCVGCGCGGSCLVGLGSRCEAPACRDLSAFVLSALSAVSPLVSPSCPAHASRLCVCPGFAPPPLSPQAEISRERVPLRNAYKSVGQKASVRVNSGVEYQVTGESAAGWSTRSRMCQQRGGVPGHG